MSKAVVKIYGIDLLPFVIIQDYRFAGHHAIASVILTQKSSFLFLTRYFYQSKRVIKENSENAKSKKGSVGHHEYFLQKHPSETPRKE